jgi:predicted amidohydrolase
MQKVLVAVIQISFSADEDQNITKAEKFIRITASQGAQIILLQEFLQILYFCRVEKPDILYGFRFRRPQISASFFGHYQRSDGCFAHKLIREKESG